MKVFLCLLVESPLEWVVSLRDRYDIAEGDCISMICEVNKPNVPAMWLKDGEQITVADGYEIIMDGCRHILRIPSCELEDDAEYTVMVGDLESITSLFVEGMKTRKIIDILQRKIYIWYNYVYRYIRQLQKELQFSLCLY